jgi:hypothetical protein
VRARIENEKLTQKIMAEERATKLAGLDQPPAPLRGKRVRVGQVSGGQHKHTIDAMDCF